MSSNCNGNSNSKVKRASSELDIKHHALTEALIEYNLIPTDTLTLSVLDNALFELNAKYKANNVIMAGYSILQTMLARNNKDEPIKDYVAYISNAIENKLNLKQVDYASSFENNASELEELKIKRVMRKHKCERDEAIKILKEEKETRENLNIGGENDE